MLGTDKQGRKEGRLNIQYPFGVTQSDCFASHLFLLNFVIAKDLKGNKDLRKAATKYSMYFLCATAVCFIAIKIMIAKSPSYCDRHSEIQSGKKEAAPYVQ